MRKEYCAAIMAFFTVAHVTAQGNFTIRAKINGLPDQSAVYLVQRGKQGNPDTIMSTKSSAGSFSFRGRMLYSGAFRYIQLPDPLRRKPLTVLVGANEKINLSGSLEQWPAISITGSKAHAGYVHFLQSDSAQKTGLTAVMQEKAKAGTDLFNLRTAHSPDTMQALIYFNKWSRAVDSLSTKRYGAWIDLVKQEPDALVAPYIISVLNTVLDPDSIFTLSQVIGPRAKKSESWEWLTKDLRIARFSANTIIGKTIPDFTSLTPEGKVLSLSEVLSKGKYTLIDFWASWCGPCREEMVQFVLPTFNKFHARGFNILGISSDHVAAAWIKAIQKDQLSWYHVSDLEGKGGTLEKMFRIYKLPMNFLLDSTGKVIATELREEALEKKLQELLP